MAVVTIKRGDTLVLTGVYKQSNGQPMNLTGYTLYVNVLNSSDRGVMSITSSTGNGNGNNQVKRLVTVTNAANGAFTLVIKDTSVLREEDYWIDFKAVGSNGYEQTSQVLKLKVKSKLV